MSAPLPGDRALVTVTVAAPPEVAFEVFTRDIDLWWRQGPRFRMAGREVGKIYFEPRVGGRLYESIDSKTGPTTREIGRVLVFEPSTRLVLEWRAQNFAPGEKTEVEVTFQLSRSGTRVTLEHRGWASIRADHPARHGQPVAKFIAATGRWWGDQMTTLRELASEKATEGGSA